MISVNRLCLALLPIGLVVLSGCTSSSTKVHGKVIYHDKPVTGGTITFHLPDGGIFPYALSPEGEYSGAGLPTGEMTVSIDTESLNPKGRPEQKYGGKAGAGSEDYMKMMKERGNIPAGAIIKNGEYVKIPEKYRDPKTSDLKVNLVKGQNELNFTLKDD